MYKPGRSALIVILLSVLFNFGCSGSENRAVGKPSSGMTVVATLFPLYDFARAISGGRADVVLLVPPGLEPHSFEPRAGDMVMLNRADIFVFTNRFMEPWAEDLLRGAGSKSLNVVDASNGVRFISPDRQDLNGKRIIIKHVSDKHKGPDSDFVKGVDPHIWLDFGNAEIMADNILGAFLGRDPQNADFYRSNAEMLKKRLSVLDSLYKRRLAGCRKRIIVNGGHYTFGYLAERYGLKYIAVNGLSPDAEPSAKDLADITKTIRRYGIKYIFHEELLQPRVAETIAKETDASLLKLNGAHNISRDELAVNRTFIEIMEKNLDNLMTGLECR